MDNKGLIPDIEKDADAKGDILHGISPFFALKRRIFPQRTNAGVSSLIISGFTFPADI